MSQFLSDKIDQAIVYKLVIIRVILYTLFVAGTSWQSSMANVIWGNLLPAEKFNIFVAMFVTWSTVMLAFLDRSISRLASGQNPLTDEEKTAIAAETSAKIQSDASVIVPNKDIPVTEVVVNETKQTNENEKPVDPV